ncbi:MAG: glycosyltransferase [Candidatus Brockarchaeota archaeon]|nr:glycosyltransferase [Candidatus Brockarchaeota archaeon]
MITIAMTLKNSIKTLKDALQGIKKLQYDKKRIKIVFVDGGSTDGSLKILEEFRDQNINEYSDIKVISGDYNITEGRNTCIRNAEGDFILFIDSDVVVPPDLLIELENLFSSDPKIAFVNVPCIVEKGKEGWVDKFYRSIGEPQGMSCAALRISALKEVGPYFVGFPKGENPNELIFRLKKRGYGYTVLKKEALHIKHKPRGFLDYLKYCFSASVIYHYQEIKSGSKYLILKYLYYSALLGSLVLIPFLLLFFIPFLLLLMILFILYLKRSHGNPYSLLAIIAGMVLPIGMLFLILKRIFKKSQF